jgi:hypothetical protein
MAWNYRLGAVIREMANLWSETPLKRTVLFSKADIPGRELR